MPYKGWKTVAIRDATYDALKAQAVTEIRSMAYIADRELSKWLETMGESNA